MPRASLICTFLALVLAGLLGGCGDSGDGGNGGDSAAVAAMVRAANVSSDYGARFRMEGTIDAQGQKIPITGRAAVEPGGKRAVVRSFVQGIEFKVFMEGQYMLMSANLLPGQPGLPAGTRWVRFDVDKVGQSVGLNTGPLRRLQSLDPASAAKIGAAAGNVHAVGTATEDGVKVTRYESSAKLGEITKALSDGKDDADKLPKELRDAKMDSLISIDDQDRVKSFRIRFGISDLKMDLNTTITSFSKDIEVAVPSGSEVYDATSSMVDELNGLSG